MKLQTLLIIFPLLVAANPLAAPEALPEPDALAEPIAEPAAEAIAEPAADAVARRAALVARAAQTCALTGANVKYRKCPSTDDKKCPAIGEYGAKGTKVSFKCFTTGSSVKGDTFWDKTSKGYYVSETLVNKDCAYKLDPCGTAFEKV